MKKRAPHPFRNLTLALAFLALPLQGAGGLATLICYAPLIIGEIAWEVFKHAVLPDSFVASRSVEGVGVQSRSEALQAVDCSGVENEFDALYVGDLLKAPRLHVETIDGGLSEAEFAGVERDGLRLAGGTPGAAIGVSRTDQGNDAKFLFEWVDGEDGARYVRLHEVTVLHPTSGERVHYVEGPTDLPPRVAIDLDPTGSEGPTETDAGHDLVFAPDEGGDLILVPGEGASLSVPKRSVCP